MKPKLEILKDRRIIIKTPHETFRGTVISAINWAYPGEEDDWYIEITDDRFGYVYWKQRYDGGGTVDMEVPTT